MVALVLGSESRSRWEVVLMVLMTLKSMILTAKMTTGVNSRTRRYGGNPR
jgi:hypothetical protein